MSVTTRTNLLTNGSFEANTTGWATVNATVATSTAKAKVGTQSMSVTAAAVGAFSVNTPTGTSGIAVNPSTSYALQGQSAAAATSETVTASITWYDASGTKISQPVGIGVTDSTSGFTQATVVATSPSNAAYASVEFAWTNGAAGEVHYLDACLLEAASTVGTYFDGSFVSAAGVVYAWTGTAYASTSTATTYQPYITLSSGTSPSPNVTVTYQDFDQQAGGDTINVWRTVDGRRRPVRGARRRNVVGSDFVVDYEAALGRTVSYDIEVLSGVCAGVVITTATITLTSSSGWLSDPLQPGTAVAVYSDVGPNGEPGLDWDALAQFEYKAAVTQMIVAGTDEPVAMVGQRQSMDQVDVHMTTLATSQSNALRVLLKQASVVLFRPLPEWASALPGLCYIVAPSILELPVNEKMGGQQVAWQAKSDIVAPPAADVLAPTTTYGTVSGNYATYADFNAAHTGQSYLQMEQNP